jgi:hypothetical protein
MGHNDDRMFAQVLRDFWRVVREIAQGLMMPTTST